MVTTVVRQCCSCGRMQPDPPRDPRWSRWTGWTGASWPCLEEEYRTAAPAVGEVVELQLSPPFSLTDRFSALFLPALVECNGYADHPELLPEARLVDLELQGDLGDVPNSSRARVRGRVERVLPADAFAREEGPTDRPGWFAVERRLLQILPTPFGLVVSFSMEGDVTGDWWLQRDEEGWRLFLEEEAGFHYRWAYAGGHRLDDEERAWIEGLLREGQR